MKIRTAAFAAAVFATLLVFAPSPSFAQESAPELPPANPVSQVMTNLNPMNWKMPSFGSILPTKDEKDRVITKKNNLVTEVSTTAKQSWQRTKETLNPMRLIPAGFRQNSTTTQPAQTQKSEGFFSKLLSPFPEKKDPEPTVTDWLKQDPVK
ncbi:hypothetical protein [Roseiconus lacunae]|uniref:Uncharacterized protein n=1 Tax=Roseiconus lacunae TaxID=2605694 RepID=A0ABT7PEM0_9BACT|nr:hypothetical protein [Roseiconus lacunae]MCD0463739.1 hypothetical protein [Roseiconus lacunae]MDM4014671.1 hypothetical protein [Roseiconus lacunae]WRQ50286.1 hypothetical protein U8335_25455 [Stieleria sp. HD01]